MNLDLRLPPELKLTNKQRQFLYCMMPQACFIGGLGSGKTLIGSVKAIVLSALHRGGGGVLVSPTFSMLKTTLLVTLEQLFDDMGLSDYVERRKADMELRFPWGSYIYLRSAEHPLRLRGPNLCWALIDEATLIRDFSQTLIAVSSRLRDAKHVARVDDRPLYHLGVTGSPEGTLDQVYDTFFRPPENAKLRERWERSTFSVQASSYDNPGLDAISLETLEMNTPEHLRPALIGGKWIDVDRGLTYYNFDRDRHVTHNAKYLPKLPLRFSWDFNLTPMTCEVAQIYKVKNERGKTNRRLRFVDEFSYSSSNTPEICRAIISRYGFRGLNHRGDIYIYGDATGDKGTAEKTDYDTIKEMLGEHFPGQILMRVPNSNPTHKSRVRSGNVLFSDGRGQSSIEINPRCRSLIRDCEYQRWDPKAPKSKDKRQMVAGHSIGHAGDGLDYIVAKEFSHRAPDRAVNPVLEALTDRRWGGLPEKEPS